MSEQAHIEKHLANASRLLLTIPTEQMAAMPLDLLERIGDAHHQVCLAGMRVARDEKTER